MTEARKLTPEMALEAKKRSDRELALVGGYTHLLRDMHDPSKVAEQTELAVECVDIPLFRAGISVLADAGDFDLLADLIGKVTANQREKFEGDFALREALIKAMLSVGKNRFELLHAYGKSLHRRAYFSNKGKAASFASLEDFLNDVMLEGDSPDVSEKISANGILFYGNKGSMKKWGERRSIFRSLSE